MKTEAEIREALGHLEDALIGAAFLRDMARVKFYTHLINVFKWTVGEPNTFQVEFIDKSREIDEKSKALKQAGLN